MSGRKKSSSLKYSRVLLKLSGEAFAGKERFGIDPARLNWIANQVVEATKTGAELALVVGGGNFFRGGREGWGIKDRVSVDYLGMLATVMNAIALQEALGQRGVESRVLSAIEVPQICEPYIRPRALAHLDKGRVVILSAGTGNPFFTTDTAAALRALELEASALFKATRVKGVYDSDPEKNPNAQFYPRLSYNQALSQELKIMDATALSLCRDHQLPILVFNLFEKGNLKRALLGKKVGTIVC